MKTCFLIILFTFFLVLSGCGDEGQDGLTGPRDLPINFSISDSFPSGVTKTIIEAGQKWEEVVGLRLFVFETVDSNLDPSTDGLNVITTGDVTAGALGQTQTTFISGNLESDIIISSAFDYTNFDFFSHIAHELGNALQIPDTNDANAIMNGDLDPGEKNFFTTADNQLFFNRYKRD